MVEVPKITRRKPKDDVAEKETTVATEVAPSNGDGDSPVITAAYAGAETDAMKRAKELLARKRQQIIDNAKSMEEN